MDNENSLELDTAATVVGPMSTMPTTGLFMLIWIIIQFVFIGGCCLCVAVMFIAFRDHFNKYSAAMSAGMQVAK